MTCTNAIVSYSYEKSMIRSSLTFGNNPVIKAPVKKMKVKCENVFSWQHFDVTTAEFLKEEKEP